MAGWLLASTDANQDEDENRRCIFENALIEINHLFRMAEELPFVGFDPYAFEYDPLWIPESSQLAHTAIADEGHEHDRAIAFLVQCHRHQGRYTVPSENSFKYRDEFFTSCAETAGFTVMKRWEHHRKPMRLFSLASEAERLL